ncbi:TPA: PIG-L family deacetylase, partial [Candidatus Poribacteria bacterium]|nr:PIG-L family deacetylase [Candidatus Poribacteria bacterium]
MEQHETTNKRILAVGAHPDDVEFLIAGTLTLLYQKGYTIHIATVATGDMGSMELRSQRISSKRYKEAVNAAKILDASYQSLGESDLSIVFDNPTR